MKTLGKFVPVLLFTSLHAHDHLEKNQKSAALSSSLYLEHLVSQASYTPPDTLQAHTSRCYLDRKVSQEKHHKFWTCDFK